MIDGGKAYTPLQCVGYRHHSKTHRGPGRSLAACPRCIGSLAISRLGSTAHIMAAVTTSYRSTSTSLPFASTGTAPR